MTDCGVVNHFLGIKILYDHATGCMYLTQEAAVDRVLTKFGMQTSNPEERLLSARTSCKSCVASLSSIAGQTHVHDAVCPTRHMLCG
ncbi:AAEL017173-PA [Aedes aegypti]|uniref:AAEL017173-PA n=1 Tax=Aedes aegypti TaxID=7159 RepID=J9HYU8_AEDAE|nr:AAEL017173-PA [Aedes aegypti]